MNRLIKSYGFTQKQLALQMGISTVSLSNKLNFKNNKELKLSEIKMISKILDCDFYLFLNKYLEYESI